MKYCSKCGNFYCTCQTEPFFNDFIPPPPKPVYGGLGGSMIGTEDPVTHSLNIPFDEGLNLCKVDPVGNVCDLFGNPTGLQRDIIGQIRPADYLTDLNDPGSIYEKGGKFDTTQGDMFNRGGPFQPDSEKDPFGGPGGGGFSPNGF